MTVRLPLRVPQDLAVASSAVRVALRAHGVTALPTETFYGLAVDPHDGEAVDRVFELKGRPADRALPVVGASLAQLAELVVIPELWRRRLAAAWPAPLTVVLPARERTPAGGLTLAVRVPAHDLLRGLLARVGPLTATSANRSGSPPAASVADVEAAFPSGLELVLDGGATAGDRPSTLLDCTSEVPVRLRAGAWAVPPEWDVKTG